MFQYLPSPAAKEIRDNVGSMSPCIVMKDDGIRCQQVLSLSPECWTKMITEETAVVGSVYCLSLRDIVVQYHSINVIGTMNIAFTLLCVGRTFFGRGEPGCFHSFDCRFKCGSYERAQVSSRVTILPRKSSPSLWYRFNKSCAIAYRCHFCTSDSVWGTQCAAVLR